MKAGASRLCRGAPDSHMAGVTDYERGLIGDFFRKANAVRGKARMRASMPKSASERTPMLSQLGRILHDAGTVQEKPAEIVKRVITKASPVTAENVRKLSAKEALAMLKESLIVPKIGLREAKDVVLKSRAVPRAGVRRGVPARKTLGLEKEDQSFLASFRERVMSGVGKQAAAPPMTPFAKAIAKRKIGVPTDTGLFMHRSGPQAGSLGQRTPKIPGIGGPA